MGARIDPTPASERILNKVSPEPNTGCWLWMGATTDQGYGTLSFNAKTTYAHRLSYSTFVGEIPEGLELDHKCRMHICVNPQHLEPVTHEENCKRGEWLAFKKAAHCVNGHEFNLENTYIRKEGRRQCKACAATRNRERVKSHALNNRSE